MNSAEPYNLNGDPAEHRGREPQGGWQLDWKWWLIDAALALIPAFDLHFFHPAPLWGQFLVYAAAFAILRISDGWAVTREWGREGIRIWLLIVVEIAIKFFGAIACDDQGKNCYSVFFGRRV